MVGHGLAAKGLLSLNVFFINSYSVNELTLVFHSLTGLLFPVIYSCWWPGY